MTNNIYQKLIERLLQDRVTMIGMDGFTSILRHSDKIKKLPGDIVECGVWRGGMSIFLSKVFSDKKIWCCDSFQGCQDPSTGKYVYNKETHGLGLFAIFLEEVVYNFEKYNLLFPQIPTDLSKVAFLKGWVKDTLSPATCPIESIALLRVDVDSYSATIETIEYLYDKVVSGGIIVFDDSCVSEAWEGMKYYFKNKPIPKFFDATTDREISLYEPMPCCAYMVKP